MHNIFKKFSPGFLELIVIPITLSSLIILFSLVFAANWIIVPTGIFAFLWAGFVAFGSLAPQSTMYGPVLSKLHSSQKTIALTFDDGPHPEFTPRLLDVLKKEEVKATFFLTGKNVTTYPEIVRRIGVEGHAIGNHSYSHRPLIFCRTRKELLSEIDDTQRAIFNVTASTPSLFRAPFGFSDPKLHAALRERRLHPLGWSNTVWDWTTPGVRKIVSTIVKAGTPGDIVLLHDGSEFTYNKDRSQTVAAVEEIISHFRAEGYSFVRIPENGNGIS